MLSMKCLIALVVKRLPAGFFFPTHALGNIRHKDIKQIAAVFGMDEVTPIGHPLDGAVFANNAILQVIELVDVFANLSRNAMLGSI